MKNPVIVGIDPGTVLSGYGVIRRLPCGLEAIDYGCIRPPKNETMAVRCHYILNGLEELLQKVEPDFLVVETQYVAKNVAKINVQSVIKLGMVRGIVLAVAKKFRVKEIIECPPALAKKAVTGRGQASKAQVQSMVQWLLNLVEIPKPQDAADALALAIYFANKLRF